VTTASPIFRAPHSWTVRIRTSSLNEQRRQHWTIRRRRTADERFAVSATIGNRIRGLLPCAVTLTRIGPKRLDDDNLAGALKAVRDAVADALGCDDADARLKFLYAQEKGDSQEYAVRIEVRPTERL
jgi:hypothetical protein